MGMRVDKDILLRPVLHQDIEDFLHRASFLASCVKFAVGIRSGAPLPETIVGIGINHILARQARHVLASVLHRFASFEQNRPYPLLYQAQGGEQSGRAGPDNYGRWRVGRQFAILYRRQN